MVVLLHHHQQRVERRLQRLERIASRVPCLLDEDAAFSVISDLRMIRFGHFFYSDVVECWDDQPPGVLRNNAAQDVLEDRAPSRDRYTYALFATCFCIGRWYSWQYLSSIYCCSTLPTHAHAPIYGYYTFRRILLYMFEKKLITYICMCRQPQRTPDCILCYMDVKTAGRFMCTPTDR